MRLKITHCVMQMKLFIIYTRWFKYDRDYFCVNKSQFVPVIFEPPCILHTTVYVFTYEHYTVGQD
jgi:hypothetical protein